jgi:hypothetical protein
MMRILVLFCMGGAGIGLAATCFMGDSEPAFALPVLLVSGSAAILSIIASLVAKLIRPPRKYQCLNCGKMLQGSDPGSIGILCPNCGGSNFRLA